MRAGHVVPLPNPSAVGGLLKLLPQRERVVACQSGDGLGMGTSWPPPRASNSQLRTGTDKGNPTI